MFFRGKQPEASIWRRFRASTDGFTFTEEEGVYTAHVVANAERVVDLFWTLAELLSPAVDLFVDDLRSGRKWKGEALPLPDARHGRASQAAAGALRRRGDERLHVGGSALAQPAPRAVHLLEVGQVAVPARGSRTGRAEPSAVEKLADQASGLSRGARSGQRRSHSGGTAGTAARVSSIRSRRPRPLRD